MIVKKSFTITQYQEEADYLEAQAKAGLTLIKALGDGFEFKSESPSNQSYRVEFSIEPLTDVPETVYEIVDVYHSSKGGYYTYLRKIGEGMYQSNLDRVDVMSLQKKRMEMFGGFVVSGLVVLFTYLLITQGHLSYLVVIIAGLILGLTVFQETNKLKREIEKLTK